jgi:hypothetical protein
MSIGFIFWCIMVLWLLSKLAIWRGMGGPWVLGSSDWLLWILFFLVGWRVFGFIIQG